jgi:hypothetical protein
MNATLLSESIAPIAFPALDRDVAPAVAGHAESSEN